VEPEPSCWEDALADMRRGLVPLITPIPEQEGGGLRLGVWHPGPVDLTMINSPHPRERAAFALIMLNEHRIKNGWPHVRCAR
jgi:hypothetical protein